MGLHLIAQIDWNALGGTAWQIGSVACGLGFVIFVHELGHFLVAKWCGVKCEKFYVGFDVPIKILGLQLPSKLAHFQWGETEYGIGIIPLGGYVKMLGQDDDPRAAQAEMERIKIKKSDNTDSDASDDEATGAATEQAAMTAAPNGATSAPDPNDDEYELDPRSFPAKSVPQRMAIISAGVIMNLIFAVIFATFAFRSGVTYTPCEVGTVVPGSPAWKSGVEPGTRIVQIGDTDRRESFMRFMWDLSNRVNMLDDGESMKFVTRDSQGDEKSFEIVPDTIKTPRATQRLLGIGQAQELRLSPKLPVLPASSAAKTSFELKKDDRIVLLDGKPLDDAYHLTSMLAENVDAPITVTIERKGDGAAEDAAPQTHEVSIDPNPIRRLGLVMQQGPIVGIRPGSPAAEAGFQAGDIIETVAGESVGDPMSLPTQLRPYYGTEITVEVRRDGTTVALQVTPRQPTDFDWTFSVNSPMAALALGVAYEVTSDVVSVLPDSPAAAVGIQAGDVITAYKAKYDNPKERAEVKANKAAMLTIDNKNITWPGVFDACQNMKDDISLILSVRRDGQIIDFTLKPEATEELNPHRGLFLASMSDEYFAKSWSEAVTLGARRTWEDAMHVATFLKKLVTGRIALTNVGGPLVIATVAGSEASVGLSRLLIFLTFLSANLAIVNFLPIPALDGGHFIFLLWEGISGKPVNERVQIALTLVGVGCLLCLMIFVVGMDINRLFF